MCVQSAAWLTPGAASVLRVGDELGMWTDGPAAQERWSAQAKDLALSLADGLEHEADEPAVLYETHQHIGGATLLGVEAEVEVDRASYGAPRWFDQSDGDGDGILTKRELEASLTAHAVKAVLAMKDLDGDGRVSEEEYESPYDRADMAAQADSPVW